MNETEKYERVIGLEVHVQLSSLSKIFCSDATTFGNPPNFNTGPVSLGHPGTLPVLNKEVLKMAVQLGLATRSEISRNFYFSRKNYFYTDLPKGYQVSQDTTPVCLGGEIEIKNDAGGKKKIALTRIHMEEDAGKSIHDLNPDYSLIDLNRAGVPLVEIVTEPDLRSSGEAYQFLAEIRKLVRYLGICDGNMEEGSLRCDANVSLRPAGVEYYGTRTEIKNLNSLNNVKKAINLEVSRQKMILGKGGNVRRETLHYDTVNDMLIPLRSKEEAQDYRYFPEPDLTPVKISEEYIKTLQDQMPELPGEVYERMITEFGLSEYDAGVISEDALIAGYFMETASRTNNYKNIANWIMGPVKSYLNEKKLSIKEYFLQPDALAIIIDMIDKGIISHGIAVKKLLPLLEEDSGKDPGFLAKQHNLIMSSDTNELEEIARQVLNENPSKVKAYQKGKIGLSGFFMGQIMKKSGGKADPKLTREILNELLNN
ncbi:MAG: Asp-tRNA(Asn)/Glu-tRNA(Gln) amidotransferase subunit GatB [Bacteroidota bacterium]